MHITLFTEVWKKGFFRPDINYHIVVEVARESVRFAMTNQLYKEHGLQMVFRNIILLFIRGICTLNGLKMLERIEWWVGEAAVISQWGVCRACHIVIEPFGKQMVDEEYILTTPLLYFAYW